MKQPYYDRVQALRGRMAAHGIDVYLIVSDDFHASEYVGDFFKCREYISGFDGSAGTLVITKEEAGLWTDARYFIQAREQLQGTGISLRKMGETGVPTIPEYMAEVLQEGACLGYDGRTVSESYASQIKKKLENRQIRYEERVDLVGEIWRDRPELSAQASWLLNQDYTGKSRSDKLKELRSQIVAQGARAHLLASLDDIAWLYNIRGNDVAYTPVVLAYTLIDPDNARLYVNPKVIGDEVREALEADGIEVHPYQQVYEDVAKLDDISLLLDKQFVNVALLSAIPQRVTVIDRANPTSLAKAVKNPVEMDHVRMAHIRDGVAVTRLIYWLKQQQASAEWNRKRLTELDVARRLEACRKEQQGFLEQSFAPIIASGAHGAIVHYEPTEETDIPLEDNTFVLMDTGGQYLEGTTDITRTVAVGALTRRQKEDYTTVLRGNLNLGAAHFKYGCTGANLDYLARAPLWERGMDYDHGTGHGVGYLLSVHEGPNSIRLKGRNDSLGVKLEEGMITSNEPGIYLEGQYGIRIENLILCKKAEKTAYGQFMEFETLTLVPYEREAILTEWLSEREIRLLNSYHERVYETLQGYLPPEEREWLAEVTRPLGEA